MTQEALKELLEAVEAAIQAGDWKVDGACDPDLVIRRAKKALAQPQCQWVGLTDEEIKALPQWFPSHETAAVLPLIRAIEVKLREKNT